MIFSPIPDCAWHGYPEGSVSASDDKWDYVLSGSRLTLVDDDGEETNLEFATPADARAAAVSLMGIYK